MGTTFTPGLLDPEDLGCRTHFWALKAAGGGVRGALGAVSDQRPPRIMARGGEQTETLATNPLQRCRPEDLEMRCFV